MKNSKITILLLLLIAAFIWLNNIQSLWQNWSETTEATDLPDRKQQIQLDIRTWAQLMEPVSVAEAVAPVWEPFTKRKVAPEPKPEPKPEPQKPKPQPKPKPRVPPFNLTYLGFFVGTEKDAEKPQSIYMQRGQDILILQVGDVVDAWLLAEISDEQIVFVTENEQTKVIER